MNSRSPLNAMACIINHYFEDMIALISEQCSVIALWKMGMEDFFNS